MKFSIDKAVLADGLQQVLNVAGTKTNAPILMNVLLEANKQNVLQLSTTNMDISICCSLSADVSVFGSLTVPVKKFLSIVRSLPDQVVQVEVRDGNVLALSSGGSQFKVHGLPASDFPRAHAATNAGSFTMNQSKLLQILKSISYAQSKDENRYLMNGVYCSVEDDNLCLIATDGRRLAVNSCEYTKTEGVKNVIIPAKTISELEHILGLGEEVVVYISDKQVDFQINVSSDTDSGLVDCIYIISKIVEGKYPNYKQVIPSVCERRIRFDRETLLEVIQRVALVADEKNYTVKMNISSGEVVVSAQSAAYGDAQEKIIVDYTDSPVEIGFNPQFLSDPLKALKSDEVFFEFKDAISPGVIKGDDAFLCVVMPLRI